MMTFTGHAVAGNLLPLRRISLFCEPAVNDDAQLIEQALAGHSAAFGELVQKYQDRLYNTVFHVVGKAEDAKDVVQDAFVQAFLKLETFRRTARFILGFIGLPLTWPPAATAAAMRRVGGTGPREQRRRNRWWRRQPGERMEREAAAGRSARRSPRWATNTERVWCCGRSTVVVMKLSPISSDCPRHCPQPACTGRGCNCGRIERSIE